MDDLLVRNETVSEFEMGYQRMVIGMRVAIAEQLDQHISASLKQDILLFRCVEEIALLIGQNLSVSDSNEFYTPWPVDRVVIFQLERTTHIEPL